MNEEMINEEGKQDKMKQWIQDNLRIIISILIVVLIAGGIYSYSKRTPSPTPEETGVTSEEEVKDSSATTEGEAGKTEDAEKSETEKAAATPEIVSQETDQAFVETAVKGNGSTHLARRALANYLEKTPDSELTAEHKIYIEDYLRKHAAPNKRIYVGTSVEFSKDLIKNAIEKSKKLNERQLKNLHKYAVKVPSLS